MMKTWLLGMACRGLLWIRTPNFSRLAWQSCRSELLEHLSHPILSHSFLLDPMWTLSPPRLTRVSTWCTYLLLWWSCLQEVLLHPREVTSLLLWSSVPLSFQWQNIIIVKRPVVPKTSDVYLPHWTINARRVGTGQCVRLVQHCLPCSVSGLHSKWMSLSLKSLSLNSIAKYLSGSLYSSSCFLFIITEYNQIIRKRCITGIDCNLLHGFF